MAMYPGRVVTVNILASLVAETYSQSFTTINIMSGFKKCGLYDLYPFNPSAVDDRKCAPSLKFKTFGGSLNQLEERVV